MPAGQVPRCPQAVWMAPAQALWPAVSVILTEDLLSRVLEREEGEGETDTWMSE